MKLTFTNIPMPPFAEGMKSNSFIYTIKVEEQQPALVTFVKEVGQVFGSVDSGRLHIASLQIDSDSVNLDKGNVLRAFIDFLKGENEISVVQIVFSPEDAEDHCEDSLSDDSDMYFKNLNSRMDKKSAALNTTIGEIIGSLGYTNILVTNENSEYALVYFSLTNLTPEVLAY